VTRSRRRTAKKKKFEARNPKFETISNDRKYVKFQTSFLRIRCFGFSRCEINLRLSLFRISLFGFWICFAGLSAQILFHQAVGKVLNRRRNDDKLPQDRVRFVGQKYLRIFAADSFHFSLEFRAFLHAGEAVSQ